MNIEILALIRSENERRNAPAVLAINEKRGRNKININNRLGKVKFLLSSVKNSYNGLLKIASIKENKIIIPGKGHKYDEVIEELTLSGISVQNISITGENSVSIFQRMYLAFLVFGYFFKVSKINKTEYSKDYLEIILLFLCLKKLLVNRFTGKCNWIIIGDLSTYLISLSAAVKSFKQQVIYWQYSFLDFKHLPCTANKAIILNDKGIELSKIRNSAKVYWREIEVVNKLRLDKLKKGPIGILLNVHASQESLELILKLYKIIKLPFEIRKHPNSKLDFKGLPDEITLADSNEDLDKFAERISLGICGNTQAQAKLLMQGTPVLQVAGLDLLDFDFHGYIKKNIVFGIEDPNDFSFDRLKAFYQSDLYKDGLYNLIGPTGKNRVPILKPEIFN